jgi:hypothetical protein
MELILSLAVGIFLLCMLYRLANMQSAPIHQQKKGSKRKFLLRQEMSAEEYERDLAQVKKRVQQKMDRLQSQDVAMRIKYGPRGGRFTMARDKNGRPYRRYF